MKNVFNKTKIFFVFAFMLSFAILLASGASKLLTVGIISSSGTSKISIGNLSCYAVSAYEDSDILACEDVAAEISVKGGAGYIYSEKNKNYVLTSFYLKKADAESVKDNLKSSYNASVITIKIKKITLREEKEKKDLFFNINKNLTDLIDFFGKNSILLDQNKINKSEILLESVKYIAKFEENIIALETAVSENEINLRLFLKTIKSSLQLLSAPENFNQFFKYAGLNFIVSMQNCYNRLA